VLRDDATFPPSPTPPPTPDPDRDLAQLPALEAEAEARAAAKAALEAAGLSEMQSATSVTMESSLMRAPRRKPKPPKPQSILSKLDTAHPGFRADENVVPSRSAQDVPEHEDAKFFIRHGGVWCHTTARGEFQYA
jgi:hypothetical protein